MAASTAIAALPPPQQIAKGLAGAVPADLSKSPLLGILGVIMGAGIVSLMGRMVTLGLADLKGHLGIGFDDGAWISSAYNVALMFIGPFTVYLGALIGPRRILMVAAAVFTIALYATFVDGAVNIAPSLFGWYREHLSWEWMFWNSAVITPLMMLCIYFGIPSTPPPKKSSETPSFAGFLYASAGFAMLFAAFDQGERLDWWRSGLFTALFAGGSFLLLCGLARRLRSANPLVDLPYLRQWNTILLGLGLIVFRFNLLSTIVLIPLTLSIHGFEAYQIGPAVIWSAAPLLALAFVAGFFLLENLGSRLLMATGFACMAFAACLNAGITSAWSAANYYRTELLLGVGQSFAFIGLVSTIILQGTFSGAMSKPQRILTFSAYFHTIRLFGGQLGAVFMGHFIAQREKLHSNLLGLHVERGSWITDGNLHHLSLGLYSKSAGLEAAMGRAFGVMGSRLRLEAYTLTFIDGFHLLAWSCVVALLLIAVLRRSPLNYGDLGTFQQQPSERREARL